MIQKSDLKVIEEEVRRLTRDFADPEDAGTYRTSVVLLSAALGVGTDIDDLAEFTGYPRDFIATISYRMHSAGLWEDGVVHDEHWWVDDQLEKIQLVAFWMDVLVAEGCLVAKRMGDGKFRYRAAQFGPWSGLSVM